ncbi:MAG: SRPBCC family protein [Jatrophihabitantaceae bacterium]
MTHWYPLEPCDESFFDSAPYVYRFPVELDVPPERVWQSLTSERSLGAWGLGLRKLEWTSPRPFGVGTTREVVLPANAMAVRERFFRWEDGTRKSFYGTQANRPILARFAEDYLLEKTAAGSRFTWTAALEPAARAAPLLRLAHPLNLLALRSVPLRAKSYFGAHPLRD